MLWLSFDGELRQITRATNEIPGGWAAPCAQAEQRLKRGHRSLPAVVTKDELVQVDLQVSAADPMVSSDEPLLQVANRSVDAGQDRQPAGSNLLPTRDMVIARRRQAAERLEPVGVDGCAVGDVLGREVGQRGLAEIRADGHAGPAGTGPARLDGYGDERRFPALQLPTPAQTGLRSAAHPGVVEFDLPVQGLPGGVDHGPSELVQDPPGRLVPAETQLALQQQRRDSPLVRRHQIGGPKPHRQRGLGPVEDGAGGQRHLVATRRAFPPPLAQEVRPAVAAAGTLKTIGPSARLQVLLAGRLVGELPLELLEAGREGWTRYSRTLHVGAS